MQFPLQFEYRNKFDNNKYIGTDIVLEDKYYEGKEINICTKNQFHYMYYNIFKDRDTFSLSPDFRFCHDKSKYMVFKDWLILPKEEYEILTMSNENPTRRHIQIRFRETLHEGEKIDIFYLPMSYDEIDITGDVDWNNYASNKDILISNEHLGYSFDKDLFMIALKNHKINIKLNFSMSHDIIPHLTFDCAHFKWLMGSLLSFLKDSIINFPIAQKYYLPLFGYCHLKHNKFRIKNP